MDSDDPDEIVIPLSRTKVFLFVPVALVFLGLSVWILVRRGHALRGHFGLEGRRCNRRGLCWALRLLR
jgi:hypothetical protein